MSTVVNHHVCLDQPRRRDRFLAIFRNFLQFFQRRRSNGLARQVEEAGRNNIVLDDMVTLSDTSDFDFASSVSVDLEG
jgi:hypothetical protein